MFRKAHTFIATPENVADNAITQVEAVLGSLDEARATLFDEIEDVQDEINDLSARLIKLNAKRIKIEHVIEGVSKVIYPAESQGDCGCGSDEPPRLVAAENDADA